MKKTVLSLLVPLWMVGALLSGCGQNKPEYVETVEEPVALLYDRAMSSLDDGKYGLAAKQFEEVEIQHPYSVWASRAQLMSGYVLYLKRDYGAGILAFERFIEFNPDHDRRDYAEYMLALSYYEQIVDVGRDQYLTTQAAERLQRVMEQYPKSDYARDARIKYDLTQDQLAGKHMEIGRFYQSRDLYAGSINRFRKVVEEYPTTTHVPEALFRLTECNIILGIPEDAQMFAAVLGHNYPDSRWYRKAYDLLQRNRLQPFS